MIGIPILIGLLGSAAGQAFLENRLRATVIPSQDSVRIRLQWDSLNSRQIYYNLQICDEYQICDSLRTSNNNLEVGYPSTKKLYNWRKYTITVHVSQYFGTTLWAKRTVDTGPGALPPIENFQVNPNIRSATIRWNRLSAMMQQLVDHFEILICHARKQFCLPQTKILPFERERTIENLNPGTQYNVSMAAIKSFGGKIYQSTNSTRWFYTLAVSSDKYPPVRNLKVEVKKNKNDVDLQISYNLPVSKLMYREIIIEIYDFRNRKFGTYTVNPTETFLAKNFPYFASFDVSVRVIYIEGFDRVESTATELIVKTGIAEVSKPEITTIMPVNGTTAVIQWWHAGSTSAGFSYRLQIDNRSPITLNEPEKNFTLIEGLEPEREYSVTLTAFIEYSSKSYSKTSDSKKLKMLPKDALVPKLSVKDIVGDELLLNLKVSVPEAEEDVCVFLATTCLVDANTCTKTSFRDVSLGFVPLSVTPFVDYTVNVTTICSFFETLRVEMKSETLKIFTKSRPAAVDMIEGSPTSDTKLLVGWKINPEFEKFYSGYEVQWMHLRTKSVDKKTVKETNVVLEGLKMISEYNVTVTGFFLYGEEKLIGDPRSAILHTLFVSPPMVTELTVKQTPLTPNVTVSWKSPDFEYAPLNFEVSLECYGQRTIKTTGSQIDFVVDDLEERHKRCEVAVTTFAKEGHDFMFSSNAVTASIMIEHLPNLEQCQVDFLADRRYGIKTVIPPSIQGLPLELQERAVGEKYRRTTKRSTIVITTNIYFANDSRLIRVCANGLCSAEFECKFVTRVGPPRPVKDLKVEIVNVDTLHITWSPPDVKNGLLDGYVVQISEFWTSSPRIFTKNVTTLYFDFKTNKEYTNFNVAVRAFNFEGPERTRAFYSSEVNRNVKTKGLLPQSPAELRVENVKGSGVLTWSRQADNESDVKLFRIVAKSESDLFERFSPNSFLSMTSLKPFTSYSVEVQSCLSENSKTCGKPAILDVKTDVGHPSPPTVGIVERNSSQIVFRWTVPSRPAGYIDGYEYSFVATKLQLSPINWATVDKQTRFAVLKNLEEFTEYEINVRAFNIDGKSRNLYSPIGAAKATTEGVSRGSPAPWIIAVSVFVAVIALGYVTAKKFQPNFSTNIRGLFSRKKEQLVKHQDEDL